eukprot:Skav231026  [mRNA]  locus=scaffold1869:143901:144528:- [translate_table: standard]
MQVQSAPAPAVPAPVELLPFRQYYNNHVRSLDGDNMQAAPAPVAWHLQRSEDLVTRALRWVQSWKAVAAFSGCDSFRSSVPALDFEVKEIRVSRLGELK